MTVLVVSKGDAPVALRGKNSLDHVVVGLGWNKNEGQSDDEFDLDASVVARTADGKVYEQNGVAALIYYGNAEKNKWNTPNPFKDWAHHLGDNTTGEGDGDDEQIVLHLSKVPPPVVRLDIPVQIYLGANRKQSFLLLEDAFVRLVNGDRDSDVELLRTDLTKSEFVNHQGMLFASLVRNGGVWEYHAVAESRPEWETLDGFVNSPV